MTNINELFCTPDQGRRLKELVDILQPVLVWVWVITPYEKRWSKKPIYTDKFKERYKRWHSIKEDVNIMFEDSLRHGYAAPALTLQELRDVCTIDDLFEIEADTQHTFGWPEAVSIMTAPELAAWVIERLEATP
jgi:hypothetical protein